MKRDDPSKPEFASWESYREFARRVRHSRRYVWDADTQAFLDTVLATQGDRGTKISEGTVLYRAQRGIQYQVIYDDDGQEMGEEVAGFPSARMKPLAFRATEGRANPAGISILYLASSEQTAISEVRPWIGSEVSIGQCKILRDLRVMDLTRGHGQMSFAQLQLAELEGEKLPDAKTKEKAVWIDIDNAFSQPVTLSDDAADYVPTQILAELFRKAGFHGIVYRSQFGKEGYNIALFEVDDAEVINCAPYRVSRVEVQFEEIGNRWFSTKHLKKK